jgi:hypothetical protein
MDTTIGPGLALRRAREELKNDDKDNAKLVQWDKPETDETVAEKLIDHVVMSIHDFDHELKQRLERQFTFDLRRGGAW